MTSSARQTSGSERQALPGVPHWRASRLWIVTWLLLSLLVTAPGVLAQDETPTPENQTPDTELPATNSQADEDEDSGTPSARATRTPADEETPAATSEPDEPAGSSSSSPLSGTGAGSPAVLAQGLAFQSGGQVVWQVRGVELAEFASAQPELSNAAIILQREGSSIVRNDVTAKRALLGVGEAYFKAAEDLYTTGGQGGASSVWIFEVVEQANVAEDAFYESPVVEDYAEGTYDLQLVRFVLQPDEQVDVPPHTGTALVMATQGEIEVEDDRGPNLLGVDDNGQGQGQLTTGGGTVLNGTDAPAEFVFVHFGANVDDASSGEPGAVPAATEAPSTDTTTPAAETTPPAEASGDEAAANAETPAPAAAGADGTFQTSINITAEAELVVTVTVDGIVAFDGPIPTGSSSGAIVGSVFEVTTSSGANTQFTNACGEQFVMGYGEGEESYTLTATADSCPP
ncbi:MAG: hypothetical protein H0W23_00975 [Chloroflexia bacterium]|nr:hypothetical protein [Chloroflexia bacterium]